MPEERRFSPDEDPSIIEINSDLLSDAQKKELLSSEEIRPFKRVGEINLAFDIKSNLMCHPNYGRGIFDLLKKYSLPEQILSLPKFTDPVCKAIIHLLTDGDIQLAKELEDKSHISKDILQDIAIQEATRYLSGNLEFAI